MTNEWNNTEESASAALFSDTFNIESKYFWDKLKLLCSKNTNRIIVGQINIKNIRKKFDNSVRAVTVNIGILMISETKTGNRFPTIFN